MCQLWQFHGWSLKKEEKKKQNKTSTVEGTYHSMPLWPQSSWNRFTRSALWRWGVLPSILMYPPPPTLHKMRKNEWRISNQNASESRFWMVSAPSLSFNTVSKESNISSQMQSGCCTTTGTRSVCCTTTSQPQHRTTTASHGMIELQNLRQAYIMYCLCMNIKRCQDRWGCYGC